MVGGLLCVGVGLWVVGDGGLCDAIKRERRCAPKTNLI